METKPEIQVMFLNPKVLLYTELTDHNLYLKDYCFLLKQLFIIKSKYIFYSFAF